MRQILLSMLVMAALCAQAPTPSPAPSAPASAVFTAPSTWTAMPPTLLGKSVTWRSSPPISTITVTRSPSTIPAVMMDKMLTTLAPTLLKSLLGTTVLSNLRVTSKVVTLCGNPGNVVSISLPGRPNFHSEVVIETSHAVSYTIVYAYSRAPVADHFLHVLCPAAGADVTMLPPPPGFVKRETLQPIQEWQGPQMGDVLVEMSGPPMESLAAVFQSTHTPNGTSALGGAGAAPLVGTPKNITQSCGSPAIEEDKVSTISGMTLHATVIAVRGASSSYALVYTSMGTPDAAVLTAMHAFCPP